MKLTGPQGEFELTVIDYEYSRSVQYLERNWLIVNTVTDQGNQQSRRTLTLPSTWELEMLRDWMQSVIDKAELAPGSRLLKPPSVSATCQIAQSITFFGLASTTKPNPTGTRPASPTGYR